MLFVAVMQMKSNVAGVALLYATLNPSFVVHCCISVPERVVRSMHAPCHNSLMDICELVICLDVHLAS